MFLTEFIFISTETTQLEDPRQEWRAIQEAMLREYLQTAQDVLEVSLETIIHKHSFGASNFSLNVSLVKAELIR